MEFLLTRKYVEEQISDSKIALQKHQEGVRVHEIVLSGFYKELENLPDETIVEKIVKSVKKILPKKKEK